MMNFTNLLNHLLQGDGRVLRLQEQKVWRLDRMSPFVDKTILGSHSQKEFTRRLRIKPAMFYYICSLVAPVMQTKKNIGGAIALEKKVALCLNHLGTGNYLLGCADLFGMSEALASIVVREFCHAVMKFIRPPVVPKFSKDSLPRIAAKFEEKHGIPFIMGAIDGSHIPIIAPRVDPAPFYNRKGFYSCLLQGIVDRETMFWDWDFGWAGSLHGDYLPYKLIGDATYPFRTCMYVPFKGTKQAGLPNSTGEEVSLVEASFVQALKAGVTMHWELAKSLFHTQLRENTSLPSRMYESDSLSSQESEDRLH